MVAADAAIQQQEAEVRRLEAALDFSRTEFQRAQTLSRTQTISAQAFDKAKFDVATNEAALASAQGPARRPAQRARQLRRTLDRPVQRCCPQPIRPAASGARARRAGGC